MKLNLEIRNRGHIVIVRCEGRIVYRDESTTFSTRVGGVLEHGGHVILDLTAVSTIDSAGIGELAFLQTWAQEKNAELKLAAPNAHVNALLALTNLDSVLDIYPSLTAAVESLELKSFDGKSSTGEPACAPTAEIRDC